MRSISTVSTGYGCVGRCGEGRQVVRCERCGSEEGPFDCHHTTEKDRHLGEELDHLDRMRYWCRACHQFRHGHGPDPLVPMSWRELEERIKSVE